jgi:Fe-S cluster assembly scaffold protein SufB
MTIVIPATGSAWKPLEVPRGVCAQVSVPPGTVAKLWAELPTDGDTCLSLNVGEGATCELLTIQEGAAGSVKAEGRVAAGGSLFWRPVTIGGSVRHDIRSACAGDGARSEASWIVVARAGEYPKTVIRNSFEARNGGGEVAMRAVALAKGQVLLDGRIEIGLAGGGTQTYLTQEALMLDASAKIDAIPGLEIKTNDVKASHSATVSRVNPEDLFYAGSRGIDPEAARRMLVEGFLGTLLEGIDDDALREALALRIIASAS